MPPARSPRSAPDDGKRGRERRQATRNSPPRVFRCHVELPAGWQPFTAAVLDVSTSGVGLLAPVSLGRGSLLTLHFARGSAVPPLQVQARVVYYSGPTGGNSFLGCEFVAPLTEQDLQAILR